MSLVYCSECHGLAVTGCQCPRCRDKEEAVTADWELISTLIAFVAIAATFAGYLAVVAT